MPDGPPLGPIQQPRRLLPQNAIQAIPMRPIPPLRSKPTAIVAACNACRKHKIKCTGERSACQRCRQRRIACVYTARSGDTASQALSRSHERLRERVATHEKLLDLLKNLPDRDVQIVLQRVRSGIDAAAIVDQITMGNALLQMAVAPETRLRYQFPYKNEMPADLISDNIYLKSLLYESTCHIPPSCGQRIASHDAGISDDPHLAHNQSAYLKPLHAAQVVEPLLSDAKVSWWTTVSADDMLMQDLIRVFLRCEYQFTAAFQKDLFLEDLLARRIDFCSSLLVNAVLAYSCVCYSQFSNRAHYWNPQSLLYRFLAEAKRIWELEAFESRITTIQAGIIFTVVHNLCGLDKIGKAYGTHAVAMAHKLRIFDVVDDRCNRLQRGRAFTAWTLYKWDTFTAFSFMHAPLLTQPPAWPLPDPADDAQWYGEIWLRYPLDNRILPSSFPHVFHARSRLREVMNDFCQAAYPRRQGSSLERAHALRAQLTSWFNSLPSSLKPEAIVLPGHLQLHTYFHHLMLSVYTSLCDVTMLNDGLPRQIVTDARRRLQTLIRLYYLRHGFEAMDLFIVTPLMLTAYDCIAALDGRVTDSQVEAVQSTLILSLQGLLNQRQNHYLAVALSSVVKGRMAAREIGLLKYVADADREYSEGLEELSEVVRSEWPVCVIKRTDDIEPHILGNLVRNYAHGNIETERITLQYGT